MQLSRGDQLLRYSHVANGQVDQVQVGGGKLHLGSFRGGLLRDRRDGEHFSVQWTDIKASARDCAKWNPS